MKYYTPKLEELHLGFEYEWNDPNEDDVWRIYTIIHEEELYHTIQDLKHNEGIKYRVKYLDHQDIESLGWIQPPERPYYNLGEFQLHLNINPEYNVTIFSGEYVATEKVFLGNIKNKSELKKVMEMLNI